VDGGRSPRPRPRTSSIIVRPWYAGTSDELKGVARVMRRAMTEDMWAAGAAACVQATVHMHAWRGGRHACMCASRRRTGGHWNPLFRFLLSTATANGKKDALQICSVGHVFSPSICQERARLPDY
jgi:hypothetical protein